LARLDALPDFMAEITSSIPLCLMKDVSINANPIVKSKGLFILSSVFIDILLSKNMPQSVKTGNVTKLLLISVFTLSITAKSLVLLLV
jgi:hypothetical protein